MTTICGAPEQGICRGKRKRGPGNRKNGAPEVWGPGRGTGRGEKKMIPRPAPQCGAGRGFFAGPRKIRGPACPEVNTSHTAGQGRKSIFFRPAPCPVRGPTLPEPCFRGFRGPFSLPPANSPFRGPANCSQFCAGDAYFRCMLSNKHTPDRQGWRIFTIRRLLSTGNVDHWCILALKIRRIPKASAYL